MIVISATILGNPLYSEDILKDLPSERGTHHISHPSSIRAALLLSSLFHFPSLNGCPPSRVSVFTVNRNHLLPFYCILIMLIFRSFTPTFLGFSFPICKGMGGEGENNKNSNHLLSLLSVILTFYILWWIPLSPVLSDFHFSVRNCGDGSGGKGGFGGQGDWQEASMGQLNSASSALAVMESCSGFSSQVGNNSKTNTGYRSIRDPNLMILVTIWSPDASLLCLFLGPFLLQWDRTVWLLVCCTLWMQISWRYSSNSVSMCIHLDFSLLVFECRNKFQRC